MEAEEIKYYLYRPDANNFAGIGVSSADDARVVAVHYQDSPLSSAWRPIAVHGFDDNPEAEGDFPSLSNFWRIPVFSKRAWDALRPLIGYRCEALPIIHPNDKAFYIIHVMETVDCLDADRSELKRYTDRGIMRVVHYFLRKEMLCGKHIFKLPRQSGAELIVDDEFREAVEGNALDGLVFKELRMAHAVTGEE